MKTLTLHLLVIMALATLPVGRTLAFDDGGGRSVFARGAGERALALGGSYVAVADDPVALLWNPAGLANLDRNSFYASSTNLIGMGFSERMGAIALPNWKLGTFGFAVRHFGVDGIQQRDDRGTILDDNLSDSENEVLFGFGRSFGPAWKLGLTAKYQQQDLAGYSDGALGLDVGISVEPLRAVGLESSLARHLNLGLSIRNLVEPSLRLDNESVPDPTGIRGGFALVTEFGPQMRLLTTADVDKTKDMDARLHAGAELRLLNTLDLRCGSNNGMLAAGAGIHYGGLAFDYTYEDNVISAVHRFGLAMAFGNTTAQKREQSVTAAEAAFQTRLANKVAQQTKTRNLELFAQAKQALDEGDFTGALDKTSLLRVLEPDFSGINDIAATAYMQQGMDLEKSGDLNAAAIAFQRCLSLDPDHPRTQVELESVRHRSDLETARSTEIRHLLDTGLADFAAGRLEKARRGFLAMLDLSPDDKDALTLLRNTNQALSLRAEARAEQEQKIANRRRHAAETARTPLPVAPPAISNSHPTPSPALVRPNEAPSYGDLPFKRQTEIARLYQDGVKALEEGRRDDAIRYWEMVFANAPDYQKVASNLKQEYLVRGMESFANGLLETAINTWEKALRIDPNDQRAKGYLARAYDHQARIRQIRGNE